MFYPCLDSASACLSVFHSLSIYLPVYKSAPLSIYLPLCSISCLIICTPAHPNVGPPADDRRPVARLPTCLPACPPTNFLPVCLPISNTIFSPFIVQISNGFFLRSRSFGISSGRNPPRRKLWPPELRRISSQLGIRLFLVRPDSGLPDSVKSTQPWCQCYKTFFSLLQTMRPNKLECLYPAITFQSSLTFAGNTRSLPKK
jgi:hypothetical protein